MIAPSDLLAQSRPVDIAQCAHAQWPEPAAARTETEETGRGHKEILLTLSRKGQCGANDVFN